MMVTNDIPLEGVLKYIRKDRDKYKAQLDMLIPYTKELEQRVRDLEDTIDKKTEEYGELLSRFAENEVKKAEYKQAMHDNEFMHIELKAFRSDYRQTEWYKQMVQEKKRLQNDIHMLRETLIKVQSKNDNG